VRSLLGRQRSLQVVEKGAGVFCSIRSSPHLL
jgi:hypothetical protein